MESNITYNGEDGQLTLGGELVVRHAKEIYDLIQECRSKSRNLSVELDRATEIDIAILQLFCSAHRTYQTAGRAFTIKNIPNQAIRETITTSGFARSKGCHYDKSHSCLWLHGR